MIFMTFVLEAAILAFMAGNLGRLFNDWSKKARVENDRVLTENLATHNTHYRGGCTTIRTFNESHLHVAFTVDPVELEYNSSLLRERFGKIEYADAPPKFPCHAPKDPAVDIFVLKSPNKYARDVSWHVNPDSTSSHKWRKRLVFNLILAAIALYVIRLVAVTATWLSGYSSNPQRPTKNPPPPHE